MAIGTHRVPINPYQRRFIRFAFIRIIGYS